MLFFCLLRSKGFFVRSIYPLLFSVLSLFLSACSPDTSSKSQKLWISHDVLTEKLSPTDASRILNFEKDPSSTCEEHLQKVTCVSMKKDPGFDSKCSFKTVTPGMIDSLTQIYSELPDFHQKVFCHINRIQVHPQIFSIGYVSMTLNDEGFATGSMMGLKIEMLDPEFDNQSISWKEQLNFGLTDLNDPERRPTAQGPFVEEKVSSSMPDLFAVVLHELNHLIDIYNKVNSTFEKCTPLEGQEFLGSCQFTANSFPTLSWGTETQVFLDQPPESYEYTDPPVVWANKYPLLSRLCYYWCSGKFISPSLITQTYSQLYDSPFLTGYSTSSAMEDFAESSMIWQQLQTDRPLNYVILDSSQKVIYESNVHVQNKVVQEKLNWLKNFFNRADLKYKF